MEDLRIEGRVIFLWISKKENGKIVDRIQVTKNRT